MYSIKVNLYDYFKLNRPSKGDGGNLSCLIYEEGFDYETKRKFPAILILPGGGYTFVSKREGDPIATKFFVKGFSTFVLNYTVHPNGYYPSELYEAYMALAYINENATKFRINKEEIGVIGFSAGGHLCGMVSTYTDLDKFYKENITQEKFKVGFSIYVYPVVRTDIMSKHNSINNLTNSNKDLIPTVTFLDKINENTPKAFIWTTCMDDCVDCDNSLELAKALHKNNVNCEFHMFSKGYHGEATCDLLGYRADEITDYIDVNSNWINLLYNWFKVNHIEPKE